MRADAPPPSRLLVEATLSRRAFLAGAAAVGTALASSPIADALTLLEQPDVITRDTLSGVVAFVVPGNDAYSLAQGESTSRPGGVAAGTVAALAKDLDSAIPPVPTAALLATLFNERALEVRPLALLGKFTSPFARLKFAEKGEVFRRFEADPILGITIAGWIIHVLPALVGLLAYSEAGVRRADGSLSGRPVGWEISGYDGVADGRDALLGYWPGVL